MFSTPKQNPTKTNVIEFWHKLFFFLPNWHFSLLGRQKSKAKKIKIKFTRNRHFFGKLSHIWFEINNVENYKKFCKSGVGIERGDKSLARRTPVRRCQFEGTSSKGSLVWRTPVRRTLVRNGFYFEIISSSKWFLLVRRWHFDCHGKHLDCILVLIWHPRLRLIAGTTAKWVQWMATSSL